MTIRSNNVVLGQHGNVQIVQFNEPAANVIAQDHGANIVNPNEGELEVAPHNIVAAVRRWWYGEER